MKHLAEKIFQPLFFTHPGKMFVFQSQQAYFAWVVAAYAQLKVNYNLKKMILIKYLVYSITLAIFSWIVGMMLNGVLRKKEYYNKLSNLNLIKNGSINKKIGLGIFKWVVKNTFFKYFNQNLTLKNKIDIASLNQLRTEMTFSEISHLIGFGFMAIVAFAQFIYGNYSFGLIIMIVNIYMNLYPSLLQQENKKRIDRLMKRGM